MAKTGLTELIVSVDAFNESGVAETGKLIADDGTEYDIVSYQPVIAEFRVYGRRVKKRGKK